MYSINYKSSSLFSKLINDYWFDTSKVESLIKYTPTEESFALCIDDKSKEFFDRVGLKNAIHSQYNGIELSKKVAHNIDSIERENTYFIVTAHQLNLFTGPMYYITKILSTIINAEYLSSKYPNYNIIPLFVMGSEDHDKEEICHLNLFNQKHEWNTTQTGATGRFIIDDSFEEFRLGILTSIHSEVVKDIIQTNYTKGDTLANGHRKLIDYLFRSYGLVVVDLDDVFFKNQIVDIAKDDIGNSRAENVLKGNISFLESNYHSQVKPRKTNFFSLANNERKYIDDIEHFKNTDPTDLSPNVIFRPLMQQKVLPALAYLGGAGELAYWLELKPLFEYHQINYPILLLRNHTAHLESKVLDKYLNLGLLLEDLFTSVDDQKKKYLLQNSDLEKVKSKARFDIKNGFDSMISIVENTDKTLLGSLEAEKTKAIQQLENFSQRLLKAQKRKEEETMNFIDKTNQKLLPNGSLNERYDNILQYIDQYGIECIDRMYKMIQPFSKDLLLLQHK
jgi:bacillithiol synthase